MHLLPRLLAAFLLSVGFASSAVSTATGAPGAATVASPAEVKAFLRGERKTVVTFVGYSGAGYEDPARMLAAAGAALDRYDPASTIVNIGATTEGIGAVYEIARKRGFATTGIVSTQARDDNVALSPAVDRVFFVPDQSWGGIVAATGRLSPTSQAMVDVSDVVIGIGGGDVARDELTAARALSKDVRFIAADMDHRKAIEAARRKGQPEPTEFRGSAHAALAR